MSKTPAQILVESSAAVERFTKPAKKAQPSHNRYQPIYRERRKQGLQPLPKPWDFLCSGEVKDIAWQAYRVASWYLKEDVQEGSRLSHKQLREAFAVSLAEMFKDAIMSHAVLEGGCWPVTPDTPLYDNSPQVWENLSSEVPANWAPQYALYKEVTPASVRGASGVVINIDEGNVNGTNCSS